MRRIVVRLTVADLRRRKLAALLTALVIAVAAGTLTLSVAVGRLADNPWQRTFDTTNGAHVLVQARDRATAEAAAAEPGVSAASPAIPSSFTSFRRDGRTIGAVVFGVPDGPSPVAQPFVTDGRWVERPGEVVVERSFAHYFGVEPGDRLALAATTGRVSLHVVGVAVTASQERYPQAQPGAVFVPRATLARIQPDVAAWHWILGLRLDDPARSTEVAERLHGPDSFAESWQDQRRQATEDTRTIRIILTVFGVFLLLASTFVIANQVGARVLAQLREIGVLKAVGLAPGQIAAVFAAQQLVPTVAAVAVGVPIGILAAPHFLGPSSELLDASSAPLGPGRIAAVALGVLLLVALVTLLPTWRAARRSTMAALAGSRTAVRPSRLGALAVRLGLPVPVALGVKDAFARCGRAILTVSSLVLSVVVVVAALSMEASFALEDTHFRQDIAPGETVPAPIGPPWDVFDDQSAERAQFRLIVYGLNAALLLIALANLLTTALLAIRERVRDFGVLKAVGVTPAGVRTNVISAHGLLGALAAIVGVPVGVAFFTGVYGLANGSLDDLAIPPWWQLLLILPGAVLVVGLVCAAPARLASRIRVVDALRYE